MGMNQKFDVCPLSGYKLKKESEVSITTHNHFFFVENDYTEEELYYGLSDQFVDFVLPNLSEQDKLKLWSVLVEKAIMGHKSFVIGTENVEDASREEKYWILYSYKGLLDMYPKPNELIDRVLGFFVRMGELESSLLWGTHFRNCLNPEHNLGWEPFFTRTGNEAKCIAVEMDNRGLLMVKETSSGGSFDATITLTGIEKYSATKAISESNTCFVAMQFREGPDKRNMLDFFKEVLQPAVASVPPFEAKLVSDDPSGMKICDKIIADIRKSKFVLVDLTYSNAGAYYEAGFASALNKEVIFICERKWFQDGHYNTKDGESIYTTQNNDAPNGVHFDINHYNVIVYDLTDDGIEILKREIKYHIEARILK